MTQCEKQMILAYNLISWQEFGLKDPIITDISPSTNNHILLCGMSGSGKSYAELGLFARLVVANPDCEVYFADYKQEDSFAFLRACPRYFPYKRTIEALDIVYHKLQMRQSGEDQTRNAIILIWDEYVANILSLMEQDKKKATSVMNKVSEILMIGRSPNIKILVSCQRPDAIVFPHGSRLNYGIVFILGASNRGIYEMLIPEYMHIVEGKEFKRGEGILILQGSQLNFVKIPTIQDESKIQELCIKALS